MPSRMLESKSQSPGRSWPRRAKRVAKAIADAREGLKDAWGVVDDAMREGRAAMEDARAEVKNNAKALDDVRKDGAKAIGDINRIWRQAQEDVA